MLEQDTLDVLGGVRTLGRHVHSQLDLAELIMLGLPRKAALAVRARLKLSEKELAFSLGVSPRTLQRQAKAEIERLNPAQGDRLYRLARIVAFAEEVFEDRERAHRWLREPQRGLGNRVPLDLLQSEVGAREVEDLLGRIEFGVFS
ncbi:MAG: antitoxin Xre/MbcA/ParS toxin-binding domain-containing protein [Pseudomonadota bacterium]